MAIHTVVNWGRAPSQEENDVIQNQIDAEVTLGNTDGTKVVDGFQITRPWNNIGGANQWVAFVDTFTPPPLSHNIVTT